MKHPLSTRKRYFLRRAIKYFLIMMIPTFLLMLFLLYNSFRRTDQEIRLQGEQTLNAIEMNIEQIISNAFNQSELLTSNTRTTTALKRMAMDNNLSYGDAIFLSSLGASLKSVVNSYSYMDSIILYMDNSSKCFMSDNGITNLSALSDTGWLSLYQAMQPDAQNKIVLRYGNYGQRTLTFIQRMLLQEGCVIVNVNVDRLEKNLKTLMTRPYETIAFLDNEGNVLAYASDSMQYKPDSDEIGEIYQLALSGQDTWLKIYNRYWCSNIRQSDGLIFMVAVEHQLLLNRLGTSIFNLLWLFLVEMLVVLFLAYDVTRRSFRQIEELMDMFERALQDKPIPLFSPKQHDEYGIIMNNIIYMYLKQNQLSTQLQQERYEREHSELMALQLQINPHFLYNTLQTLEIEIRSGKSSSMDRGELVRRISEILRYALADPHQPVCLKEELAYLRKYAAVQQYRFGDCFVMYFDAEDGLENAQVFRLMLQPIVENSLLHGMKGLTGRMYIEVNITRFDSDHIKFSVTDTGCGMAQDELEQLIKNIHDPSSRAIGLTNLNRRLLLCYGKESELSITSDSGKGTEISFIIPCHITED